MIKSIVELKIPDGVEVSDGYHTFTELYEHRIRLWIAYCSLVTSELETTLDNPSWRSRKHSDGSAIDGWFVLGLYRESGRQMTYHLPETMWDECSFAETLERGPVFDGHTSADVLKRLRGGRA